jgi:peptidoglycan/xylan/chitin deacetylase (PgdA/CDA1 family)
MRPIPPQDRVGLLLTSAVFGLSVLVLPAHPLVTRNDPATRPTPVLMAAAVPQLLPLSAPDPPPASPTAAATATKKPAAPAPAGPIAKQLKVKIKAKPDVLVEQQISKSGRRTVALTFDDGPDPVWTPKVLALLRRYRAVATFCMIGEKVQAHPELVTKVVNGGHRLCDHSQTHPLSLAALDEDAQRDEILDAREDLAEATKAAVPYFRAPGGNWSPEVTKFAAKKKMQPLGWTVDPRDWSLPGTPAIVSSVQGGVAPGAIVLMHDGGGPRQQTVDALATLLPWLVDHGYRFTFPTP